MLVSVADKGGVVVVDVLPTSYQEGFQHLGEPFDGQGRVEVEEEWVDVEEVLDLVE